MFTVISKIFQYFIYSVFLSVILSVGVSIFLITMSFIINGGYISWE